MLYHFTYTNLVAKNARDLQKLVTQVKGGSEKNGTKNKYKEAQTNDNNGKISLRYENEDSNVMIVSTFPSINIDNLLEI